MPAFLALTAAVFWGVGDFILGTQGRRSPVLAVALVCQVSGLVAIGLIVGGRGTKAPPEEVVLIGIATGALGAAVFCGIITALAMGNMARVAPIFGTAAVIPVAFGLARGEEPATIQLIGIIIAIGGVIMVSTERAVEEHHGHGSTRTALVIAAASAAGVGMVLVGLDRASEYDPYWATLLFRATGVAVLASAALAVVFAGRVTTGSLHLNYLPLIAFGVLDTLANTIWAVASTSGLLSVVAVLGSIFPAVTVLLAVIILKEPLDKIQAAGVVTTIVGSAMLTIG